ncbi:MAG: hypothetical protein L6265_06320, partial [Thermoplasmatales archaeon]|nr:hypothetical protein [Thermoplasmatales archaeon]
MNNKIVSIIILCLMLFSALPLSFHTTGGENEKSAKAPKSPGANGELSELTNGTGANNTDRFGWNVSYAGDLNGDGIDDIVVGAPYNDTTTAGKADAGAIYIFFGYSGINLGNLTATYANVSIYGTTTNGHFGWSVSDAGDVNQTSGGIDDLIIGEPDNGTGVAYIFFGRSSWSSSYTTANANVTLTLGSSGDKFGSSVSGAGDVNNDGYGDVIIGAYANSTNKGKAYVYYGRATWVADIYVYPDAAADEIITTGDSAGGSYADTQVDDGITRNITEKNIGGSGQTVVTYDYSSGGGTNKWAYQGLGGNDAPPADPTTGTVITDYTTIETSNDVRLANAAAGTPTTNPFHRFTFIISEAPATITNIAYLWEGCGSTDVVPNNALYIWNFATPAWVSLGSNAAVTPTDGTVSGSITTGFSNYINATGHLHLCVAGIVNAQDYIYTDYVKATVTAGTPQNYRLNVSYVLDNVGSYKSYAIKFQATALNSTTNSAENFTVNYSVDGGAWDALGIGYILNGTSEQTLSETTYAAPTINVTVRITDNTTGATPTNNTIRIDFIELQGTGILKNITLTGENDNDKFGFSVSTAGNVNGDDYDDVIVGAPGTTNGNAYIFYSWSRMNDSKVLVVDDNAIGGFDGSAKNFSDRLKNLGYLVTEECSSDAYMMDSNAENKWLAYDFMVWSCGATANVTNFLNTNLRDNLADYTQAGGRLIVEGGDIGYQVSNAGWAEFMDDVLNIDSAIRIASVQDLDITDNTHPVTTDPNTLTDPTDLDIAYAFQGSECTIDGDVGEYNQQLATWPTDGGSSFIAHDDDSDTSNGGQIVYLATTFGVFVKDTNITSYIENMAKWVHTVSHGWNAGLANLTLKGEAADSLFGWCVSNASDVDGDNYDDVVVGAPGYSSSTGRAYVGYVPTTIVTNDTQAEWNTATTMTNVYATSDGDANLTNSSYTSHFIDNFENNTVDSNPNSPPWTTTEAASTNVAISTVHYGGAQSCMFDDDASGDSIGCSVVCANFGSAITTGVFEFWAICNDQGNAKEQFAIILRSTTTNAIVVGFYNGNFVYQVGTTVTSIPSYDEDRWYHFKLVFDASGAVDTYDYYIDGTLVGSKLAFTNNVDSINNIQVNTQPWSFGTEDTGTALGYIDDINIYEITYDTSGTLISAVNTTSHNIASVTPTLNDILWNQTLIYYISRDGGATWNSSALTSGVQYDFSTEPAGNQLQFKVEFKTSDTSVSPVLHSITIEYVMWTVITGAVTGDQFGYSVSGGNLTGDSCSEVIVGAPYNNTTTAGRTYAGAIYVFNGSSSMSSSISALNANYTNYGETAGDNFGFSVSYAGDVNNDDYNDVIVGAPYYGANDNGKAYVLTCKEEEAVYTTLTVSGVSKAPEFATIGNTNITMLNITFSSDSGGDGAVTVISINISRTGTGGSTNISGATLYNDTDGSGDLSAGDTQLNTTQTFTDGYVLFGNLNLVVYSTSNVYLFVVYNISSTATIDVTVGANVTDEAKIIVDTTNDDVVAGFSTIWSYNSTIKDKITYEIMNETGILQEGSWKLWGNWTADPNATKVNGTNWL